MNDKPTPLEPNVQRAADQGGAAKTLMEAKIMEFQGYMQLDNLEAANQARAAAHDFLDAQLDAFSRALTEIKANR